VAADQVAADDVEALACGLQGGPGRSAARQIEVWVQWRQGNADMRMTTNTLKIILGTTCELFSN
jgi:hypothetical protein